LKKGNNCIIVFGIDYFRINPNIKFIYIKRHNLLATLFSYKRVLAQQNWTTANPNIKASISAQGCSDYNENILENQIYKRNKEEQRYLVI
jgi:hypothetical protein